MLTPPAFRPRRILGRYLLVAILAFAPGIAASQEQLTFCFNHWPPFTYQDADGVGGISIELISEAARRLEVAVDFEELPWNRCLQYVKDGSVHAVVDAAKRDDYLQGPSSLGIYSDTLWVHSSSGVESPDDLRGARIGMVDGYQYSDSVNELIERLGITPELSVDDPASLRKLAFRRTDVAIADLLSTLYYAKQNRLNIRPLLPPVSYDPLYLSFHSKFTDLQKRFDEVFKNLLDEGFVDRVYLAHIGKPYSELVPSE